MSFKKPEHLQRLNPSTSGGLNLNDMALGFNREVITELNQFFSFDYMGSSKFEMGALPRAVSKFMRHYQNGEMFKLLTSVEVVQSDYHQRVSPRDTKFVPVWIIAPRSVIDDAITFIESEAAGLDNDLASKSFFQESAFFDELEKAGVLNGSRRIGWFDLDNSFIFFIDERPFQDFTSAIEYTLAQQSKPKTKRSSAAIARP